MAVNRKRFKRRFEYRFRRKQARQKAIKMVVAQMQVLSTTSLAHSHIRNMAAQTVSDEKLPEKKLAIAKASINSISMTTEGLNKYSTARKELRIAERKVSNFKYVGDL